MAEFSRSIRTPPDNAGRYERPVTPEAAGSSPVHPATVRSEISSRKPPPSDGAEDPDRGACKKVVRSFWLSAADGCEPLDESFAGTVLKRRRSISLRR